MLNMKAQKFRFIALQRLPSISTPKHGSEIVTSLDPRSLSAQTMTITAWAFQCRDDKGIDVSKKISAYFFKETP